MDQTIPALSTPAGDQGPSQEDPFSFGPASVPPPSQVTGTSTEQFQDDSTTNRRAIVYAVIGGILVLALAFGAYQILVEGISPLDGLTGLFSDKEDVSKQSPSEVESPTVERDLSEEDIEEEDRNKIQLVPGNPYWILPNVNMAQINKNSPEGSAEQEASAREKLSHPFVYQSYKVVQEVRRNRWSGSEYILSIALSNKKFWTRAFAAIGLAEMGYSVSISDLDRLLKGERSELVAGFFERFLARPNQGQAYIFRQMMRLVDAKARKVLIEGFAKAGDIQSYVYLIAAKNHDPNAKVQAKADQLLRRIKTINEDLWRLSDQVVQGQITSKEYLDAIKVADRQIYPGDHLTSVRSPSKQGKMITEGDIDAQLNEMAKDPGEVEFFEGEDSPVGSLSDSQSIVESSKKSNIDSSNSTNGKQSQETSNGSK